MNEQQIEQAVLDSKLILSLTVKEINQMLTIVGRYPFDEVHALIQRIKEEGQPQINAILAKLNEKAVTDAAVQAKRDEETPNE